MNQNVSTTIIILLILTGISAGQESAMTNDASPKSQLMVGESTKAEKSDVPNPNSSASEPPQESSELPTTPESQNLPSPRPFSNQSPVVPFSNGSSANVTPRDTSQTNLAPTVDGVTPFQDPTNGWPTAALGTVLAASRPWTGACVSRDEETAWNEDTSCSKVPASHVWAGIEGLYWWVKKQPFPQNFLSTGSPFDASPGVLGQPNTQVLFGPNQLGYGGFIGLRASAGMWFDPAQQIGFEATGFVLENRNIVTNFFTPAGGYPLLALRQFNALTGVQGAYLLSSPILPGSKIGPFAGSFDLQNSSQLWGAEANFLHALYYTKEIRLVALAGLRYLGLDEKLIMQTRTNTLNNSTLSFLDTRYMSAIQATTDSFRTNNQFYGGQIGLRGDFFFHQFFLRVGGSVALGGTDEVSEVEGITNILAKNTLPLKAPGGLYALPSNSGQFRKDDFSVVPAVQVKCGVLLTPWCRAMVGYDFLFWSQVLRPGNQMDLTVDPREIPTSPMFKAGLAATSPRPMTNQSDFWAQGLTFGLEFTF